MNLNESILKIDGLDSLSLIKSGVYKDTYHCMYKGKNAILGHYRIQAVSYTHLTLPTTPYV